MQVLRDGQWQEQNAAVLVPGDIISIKLGDIIPADARLLEGDPLKIDQASTVALSSPRMIIHVSFWGYPFFQLFMDMMNLIASLL